MTRPIVIHNKAVNKMNKHDVGSLSIVLCDSPLKKSLFSRIRLSAPTMPRFGH